VSRAIERRLIAAERRLNPSEEIIILREIISPRHHVAVLELRRIGERLKKSTPQYTGLDRLYLGVTLQY
jgi:hypothetical protein